MADSFYYKWSDDSTGQTAKSILLIDNQDIPQTFSISVGSTPENALNVKSIDFAQKQAMNSVVGEIIVGERSDNVNVMFEYNIATADTYQVQSGTGNISHGNARAILGTGTGVGRYEIISKDFVRYVTGHEVNAEMTGDFAIGEANVNQKLGIGDETDGFAGFGYDGAVFGIWMLTIDLGTFHIPQSSWNGDKMDGAGRSVARPLADHGGRATRGRGA